MATADWTPAPVELANLELLLSGAFTPLRGFLGPADTASVARDGVLIDGTPWPVPVTLPVPGELAKEPRLMLTDPEGVPVALLHVTEAWQDDQTWFLAGPVEAQTPSSHGPFRRLRRAPEEVRADLVTARSASSAPHRPGMPRNAAEPSSPPLLAVATRDPLHRQQLGQIRQLAEKLGSPALVLACALPEDGPAEGLPPGGLPSASLTRTLLAAAGELPPGSMIVPVPLAWHPDPRRDLLLRAHVAAAYGATHLMADEPAEAAPVQLLVPEPWAYDTDVEVWRPTARIEPSHIREGLTGTQLGDLLDRGEPVPDWFTPPAVAEELRRARPPRHRRGLTVLFTGLSGSGKSTLARELADVLIERGRSVTLLDGDVVRRLLSAGLTFSKSDRDLNIRRIGYVASEITRHGGVAICAPIAPYASTRAEVRRMIETTGDFALVHVSTPLAECERRDRKGLYAKARAGLIPEFTGISDPYEEPDDADITIDTTNIPVDEAVKMVISHLVSGGWLLA